MKRVIINKRSLFAVFLLTILVVTSLVTVVNNKKSFGSSQSVSATTSDNCGCNKKEKLAEIYDKPSDAELKNLISVTKSQKIYKDYAEFLSKRGYVEYTNGVFGGYFKKTPAINKNSEDKNTNLKFSYDVILKVNKPYILSVPFVNTSDNNKIAGIVFVYTQHQIISYVIEETNDPKNQNNNNANIFVEVNNGTVIGANSNDSIIDWNCARNCAIGCALDQGCWSIPYPFNIPCFAACWAICYDMCVLFP